MMEGRDDARVITLSSSPAYRIGRIAFDNLGGERRYFRWRAYAQSKLANLLFMLESSSGACAPRLHREKPGRTPRATRTPNLQFAGPPLVDRLVMRVLNRVIALTPRWVRCPRSTRGHPARPRGRHFCRAGRLVGHRPHGREARSQHPLASLQLPETHDDHDGLFAALAFLETR